jgi:transposase-like protein
MSKTQQQEENSQLKEMAKELAKGLNSEKDLANLTRDLLRLTVETALNAELESHLGYARHDTSGHGSGNSRNGYSSKRLKGDHGEIEIQTPRDRNGSFEPQLIKKRQTRLTQFNDQILSLYAKGMSTRDIAATFKEMYGAEVSPGLISQVTDSVKEEIDKWQGRSLEALYPIVYLDCIAVKIRHDKRVINKSVYIALGVNLQGHKECLGLWISENEGAKFWLSILTELQTRGLKDIFIVCVDGLSGFPEAINAVYPHSKIQLCIIHMVRNSLRFVSWKERKAVVADLKRIYQSVTESEARDELEAFAQRWDEKYPSISKSWRNHWPNLITLFDYPDDIRRAIYTTNAIESLNSVIRKAIKNRKIFPRDESALKVIYLAVEAASKKWTMPIRNWTRAINRFMIEYEERFNDFT